MRYLVPIIIVAIILSLFVEKKAGGGFRLSRRITLVQEFWIFLRERKLWWMTPIFVILILLSVFIVLTEKSVILPFIYAM